MSKLAIRVKNYKCFKGETGFDDLQRVNIIIGRNNSGKSSLLDLIEIVTLGNYRFDQATWRDNQRPQIIFESKISEAVATRTFPSGNRGGKIGGDHGVYGKKYIGRTIKWSEAEGGRGNSASLVECDDSGITPQLTGSGDYSNRLPNNMGNPLGGKVFRRLLAERDIVPEVANSTLEIGTNGSGLTNAIQNIINRSNFPSRLVESNMLDALNSIFAHDANFTDIVCQLHDDNCWEIYLEEEYKGRIALSLSGSGLKTVISVLACLILVPHLEGKELNQYIFGFEELENNIHPALLRRLNDFIYRFSIDNEFTYFLTTHSNVLIDQFSRQNDAQIIHITQGNAEAICTTAKTYIENNGILDDLDVRASDLLQANGVVWVEGPSDRIYLNRWVELWSEGVLKEGTHYQVVFYGGRLLSHLSAETPNDVDSGISILNTNRNAVMLIDSDKRNQQASINDTKERIRNEFDTIGAYCWITKGKEIENYIPASVVDEFWGLTDSTQVEKYKSFFDHIDGLVSGEGSRYNSKKPLLAEKIAKIMTKQNLMGSLDLNDRMNEICTKIRNWNS